MMAARKSRSVFQLLSRGPLAAPHFAAGGRLFHWAAIGSSERQGVAEVTHRWMAVGFERLVALDQPVQHRQIEPSGDKAQDRSGVVLGVIDETLLRERRDDEGRNARARTPAVGLRRGDMVPEPAILVVSDQ